MLQLTPSGMKSWKAEPMPDSPCETIGSISIGSVVEVTSESREEEKIFPSAPGYFEEVLVDDDVGIEFQGLNYIWRFSLGCAGVLDIVACLLPSFVESEEDEMVTGPRSNAKDIFPNYILDLASFLDHHSVTISLVFSTMWFLDAFFAAQKRRTKFLIQEEKSRYLGLNDSSTEKKPKKRWETAWFVYYRSMTLQLLLLPVGFYIILFYSVDQIIRGGAIEDLDGVNESVTVAVSNADDEIEYERFSTHSKISLLFAIIHHILLKISGSTTRAIRSRLGSFVKRARPAAIKKILSRAVSNPLKFRRNIQKVLTVVRWVKYLAPLIGTCNKLKANVSDMLKKRSQKTIADKQRRVRQLLWEGKPVHVREDEAARMIQSIFRAYKARKAIIALKALRGDKQYLAAIKVQRALRSSLSRGRKRLRSKKEELVHLSTKRSDQKETLDHHEERRFYELQDELATEAKTLINRKLLLRPNTRFSVMWKILFISCIVVEISQLLAKPWLDSYTKQRKGEPMAMSEFVALTFTPTRASLLPECGFIPESRQGTILNLKAGLFSPRHRVGNRFNDDTNDVPWFCHTPGFTIQEAYSDLLSLILVPAPVSEWPDCRDTKRRLWQKDESPPKRWYCHEPYSYMHSLYRRVFDFVLEKFLVLVSVVCFLDVFVVFFTGELDELTGKLAPKPWMARWIAPGLLLQLLLNPRLGSLSEIVGQVADEIVKLGPVRVLRWSAAAIFPVVYLLWTQFIKYVWMPLVFYENEFATIVNSML
jgi:hypothetical protein